MPVITRLGHSLRTLCVLGLLGMAGALALAPEAWARGDSKGGGDLASDLNWRPTVDLQAQAKPDFNQVKADVLLPLWAEDRSLVFGSVSSGLRGFETVSGKLGLGFRRPVAEGVVIAGQTRLGYREAASGLDFDDHPVYSLEARLTDAGFVGRGSKLTLATEFDGAGTDSRPPRMNLTLSIPLTYHGGTPSTLSATESKMLRPWP